MGHRFVYAASAAAFVGAEFFAYASFSLEPGNAAIPASIVLTIVGMLGCAVGNTLSDQERRIARLERQSPGGTSSAP